ncbi:hypothetical protein BMS3Bbin08_00077 [bacterium BMS3Bbin08]|nr:hypothetical protein BMS3Bbin08_00077 [bacterium BMS3Bbin08]
MKLWLLDADVIIDFLGIDVFDKLVEHHEIYVSSTVIEEVKFFRKEERKHEIDFKGQYIDSERVTELYASLDEISAILEKLPKTFRETIDPGELESLAILVREQEELVFCSCDAAAIRALPFLDVSHLGISAESLLRSSGLLKPGLKDRHTEEYFKSNLSIGEREKIYNFKA